MKVSISFFVVGMINILFTDLAFCQENALIVKEKQENREFFVKDSVKLIIDNNSGNINIATWDQKKIDIQTNVRGVSKSDFRSKRIVENVDFNVLENVDSIRYETIIKTPYNGNNGINGILLPPDDHQIWEVSVDYTIHVPKTIRLEIINSEGEVNIGDFEGKLQLELYGGHFTHGNLSCKENEIAVMNH